jgi:hypothetical protein
VLYIDRSTKKLQAWDDISLGGLGLASASVSRHLAQPPAEQAPPTQAPSPAADR